MQDLHAALFYGILDTGYVSDHAWEDKCRALIDGGADIIQLRAKHETPDQRRTLLERILPLFEHIDTPLVINDHLELALAYPRLGLHLGQDDMSVAEARKQLGPDRVLGLSTHSPQQAADAMLLHGQHLNYFAVGPVYATPTKPTYEPVGLELVRHVAALQAPLPWFAIGGVNRQTIAEVKAAGAPRVVVVSDVLKASDTAAAVREIRQAMAG
ncbi:MAG: thiamine-phosphate pyrophosphorylase [Puniceicoccaceae bacterium 5H]|nr:MAG: thiamine-phosphate pyrophosphorylase [Puniceicoccaceae bacterium 5H]